MINRLLDNGSCFVLRPEIMSSLFPERVYVCEMGDKQVREELGCAGKL